MVNRSLVPLVLLVQAVAAQRAPIRGAVELQDGAPWANASVTLLHRPVPSDERFGVEDRVVTTTDERGRFEAAVVPGRRYSVWAVQAMDDGKHLGSSVVEGFSFGQPLTLRAVGEPRPPARVRISGLRRWRSWAGGSHAIEVRAITDCRNMDLHALELDAKQVAELPPLPGHGARVEVLWNGAPLLSWPRPVRFGAEQPKMVRINAPRATRMDVVDASGAPAAGVDVLLGAIDTGTHERDNYCVLATSDGEGRLVVPLPIGIGRKFSWHNYPLAFRGEGWAPLQWIATLEVPADHDGAGDDAVARVEVRPSVPWRRTLTSGGAALASVPLRVQMMCGAAVPSFDGSQMVYQRNAADAQGHARIDLPPTREFAVVAFPGAEVLEGYGEPGWPVHSAVLLTVARAQVGPDVPLDLADLAVVDVEVVDPTGAPASGARLAMGRVDPRIALSGVLRDISCNHAGRVRLLVPRSNDLEVVAWTSAGWGVAGIDTRDGAPMRTQLKLQPVVELPCSLIDKDGAIDTTERLRLHFSANSGNRTLAWGMSPVFVQALTEGRFAIPLFPGMEVSFSRYSASGGYHGVGEDLDTDAPPDVLEIHLGR